MIEITKVKECETILGAGEKGVIDEIFDRMRKIAGDGQQLCDYMVNGLRPGGVWTPWCDANLTATEKTWLVNRYLELKTFLDAIA